MSVYDAIVVGTGGIGSAALYHLARRGVKALGLDRFPPGHDRGSSHGQTRMIRQAYFEHPDYVPMVLKAYQLWAEMEHRRSERLYFESGLLEIGPPDGAVVPGVLASAGQHGLDVESLTPQESMRRFPGFRVPPHLAAVFERRAGYLLVEPCVVAHLEEAVKLGAELRTSESVLGWSVDDDRVTIETDRGRYQARSAIVTAGAWAAQLLAALRLDLQVRRKPLYWYRTDADHFLLERGCPSFLHETPRGIFYGFPRIDARGMKMAEHTGGAVVTDPLTVDRSLDRADQQRVEAFAAEYLAGVTTECTHHSTCMYTMSPDEHFIVDTHRDHGNVVFCAGLSGHGFKFAPTLGLALAELALDCATSQPIRFLSARRFAQGA